MSEKAMRRVVINLLKELDADPMAVENPACPGTPDINCILLDEQYGIGEQWIELKKIKAWPKRASSIVKIPHFVNQQRIWLKKRYTCGGNVWVLLQIGKEWILFCGWEAANWLGLANKKKLLECATCHWPSVPTAEQLALGIIG